MDLHIDSNNSRRNYFIVKYIFLIDSREINKTMKDCHVRLKTVQNLKCKNT